MPIKRQFRIAFAFSIYLLMFSVKAQTWKQLSATVDSLAEKGQMEKAYELAKKAQLQAEREFGSTHVNYANTLNTIGQLAQELGDYKQAEQLMVQSVAIIERSDKPDGQDYATAIAILGSLYRVINKMPQAIAYTRKAMLIREKLFGRDTENYAELLMILGAIHYNTGPYDEAEAEMREALSIRTKLYGKQHPKYVEVISNLGNLYVQTGDYIQAESFLEESLRVREITLGKEHIYYCYTLNNLANLLSIMGDYERCIAICQEAISRMDKIYKNTDLYISTLGILAVSYERMSRFEEADSLALITLNLIEKNLGKSHSFYGVSLQGRAIIYENTGRFDEAERLYSEALNSLEASIGIENEQYISSASNMAKLLVKKMQYAKADSMYAHLLIVIERVLGRSSTQYGLLLSDQLSSFRVQQDTTKSTAILFESDRINENKLIQQLPYWTPRQREVYLAKFLPIYWADLSVAGIFYMVKEVKGLLYQKGLLLKNLMLNQQISSFLTVRSSGNISLSNLYGSIQSIRNSLALQYTLPIKQRQSIDSLEARAEILEKDLALKSVMFKKAQQSLHVRWEDIRNALKPNEAAIEFISFPFHNGYMPTNIQHYFALVLRPGDKEPQVVPLLTDETPLRRLLASPKAAQGINGLYASRGSEIDSDQLTRGDSLYQLIWKPLDHLLSGVKTVYFSPSGLLHQVSFAALPYTDKHKKGVHYLADRYKLRQVGSTRQIATLTDETDRYQNLSSVRLYGGILYDSSSISQVADATNRLAVGALNKPKQSANSWPYLSGSQNEVEQISQLIGPRATVVAGTAATEASIKALSGQSPSVLHIATHGFSFPDPILSPTDSSTTELGGGMFRRIANPLLRTGLLMAGANAAWQGTRPGLGRDDGILTAYEVANLNLSATAVVVLSACETALGDIRGSEGVFGLQRAFKMAGARYLLMSLWPVSDQATSDLMIQFYRKWKKYKTIREAFQQTQQAMRKKYLPSVWASFVLVE